MMAEITSEKQLEEWLTGKPRAWAAAIGVRAALRLVPTLNDAVRARYQRASGLTLSTFRASAIAAFSENFYNRDSAAAAARAAGTARAAAIASAAAAVAVASAAAAVASAVAGVAASAAADAARAAARAAENATDALSEIDRGFIWRNVSMDIAVLLNSDDETGEALWRTPLFDQSVIVSERYTQEQARAYLDARGKLLNDWGDLREALMARDENWQIWIDWYHDRLDGAPRKAAFDKALLALTEEEWKKEPRLVNQRLAELMAGYEAGDPRNGDQTSTAEDVGTLSSGTLSSGAISAGAISDALISGDPVLGDMAGGDVNSDITEPAAPNGLPDPPEVPPEDSRGLPIGEGADGLIGLSRDESEAAFVDDAALAVVHQRLLSMIETTLKKCGHGNSTTSVRDQLKGLKQAVGDGLAAMVREDRQANFWSFGVELSDEISAQQAAIDNPDTDIAPVPDDILKHLRTIAGHCTVLADAMPVCNRLNETLDRPDPTSSSREVADAVDRVADALSHHNELFEQALPETIKQLNRNKSSNSRMATARREVANRTNKNVLSFIMRRLAGMRDFGADVLKNTGVSACARFVVENAGVILRYCKDNPVAQGLGNVVKWLLEVLPPA